MRRERRFDHEFKHADGSFTRLRWRRSMGLDVGRACYMYVYSARGQLRTVWQLVYDGVGNLVHTERKHWRS